MTKKTKSKWFQIRNQTEANAIPEVWIYGEIGDWWDDNDAKSFSQAWNTLGSPSEVKVRIHSVGGSVIDGLAIYNIIKNSPAQITTQVDGIAASMASIIALAGDKRVSSPAALFMVHQPWGVAVGEADDMRKQAETLDKMNDIAVGIYTERTGLEETEIRAMLSEETWLSGEEALEKGFLTELQDDLKLAACGDRGVYSSALKAHTSLFANKKTPKSNAPERDNHSNGSQTMAKTQDTGEDMVYLSKADLQTQLKAEKEEGLTAGLAQQPGNSAEDITAATAQARAEGQKAGAEEMQARLTQIFEHPAAKVSTDLAMHMALKTELAAEAVIESLEVAVATVKPAAATGQSDYQKMIDDSQNTAELGDTPDAENADAGAVDDPELAAFLSDNSLGAKA